MGNIFRMLKIEAKIFIKTLPITIILFLVLPVALAVLIGSVSDMEKKKSEEVIKVSIEDEDRTSSSKKLKEFLIENEILITEKEEKIMNIIVPQGYEKSILESKQNTIKIQEPEKSASGLYQIRNLLDNYHKYIYMSNNGADADKVLGIDAKSSVVFNELNSQNDTTNSENLIGSFAIAFVGMIVGMFIINQSQVRAIDIYKNFNIRINSTANSKLKLYMIDFLSNMIQFTVILGIYVIVFRVMGKAFTGNLAVIGLMILVTSFFTSCISMFLSCVMPRMVGIVAGMFIMLSGMLSGHIQLGGIAEVLGKMNILDYITKMFESYSATLDLKNAFVAIGSIFVVSCLVMAVTLLRVRFKKVII